MARQQASPGGDADRTTRPADDELVVALRRGDEDAFRMLVDESFIGDGRVLRVLEPA